MAAERIRGVAVRTPLVPFRTADPEAPLLIKAESLQPVGAFKIRGAVNALSSLTEGERARGVVAHSSGNHAQAVAYAARALGVRAVIVMPESATAGKIAATREYGAEVVLVGDSTDERAERAGQLSADEGLVLVPPFDDPRVIAGQGTVGLEIVEDTPGVDTVLVPVSGGGLIAGIAAAVKEIAPRIAVLGVEPELAADAADSLREGTRVSWPAERTKRTMADGLRVQTVGQLTFAHMRKHVDTVVTVSESEIEEAMRRLALKASLVAEPSGAVSTAAYLFHRHELPEGRSYAAVLSGGNVDLDLFADILRRG